jgi:hypothetical protein
MAHKSPVSNPVTVLYGRVVLFQFFSFWSSFTHHIIYNSVTSLLILRRRRHWALLNFEQEHVPTLCRPKFGEKVRSISVLMTGSWLRTLQIIKSLQKFGRRGAAVAGNGAGAARGIICTDVCGPGVDCRIEGPR